MLAARLARTIPSVTGLDLDPRHGVGTIEVKDRLESAGDDFHLRVREGFLDLARRDPDRYLVLPARNPIPQIAAAVRDRLARDGRHVPVRLVDERLSTVTAQAGLRRAGRRVKDSRDVIDQAAAVVLLQAWLDSRRARR